MFNIIIYLSLLALCHAMWECEIEGSAGWAKNLPTWRLTTPFKKMLHGKEITGYHTLMFIIFGLFFHGYFLFNAWTIGSEMICSGMYLIYLILEDFLWFIVNPYYDTKKFFKQKVRWHKKWFLGVPIDYWTFILTGTYLIIFGRML